MGDDWRRKRLTVQPSFRNAKISSLATIMTNCIEELLTEWETHCDSGKTIELTCCNDAFNAKGCRKSLI